VIKRMGKRKVVKISEDLVRILDEIIAKLEKDGWDKPSYYSASKILAKKWWFKKF